MKNLSLASAALALSLTFGTHANADEGDKIIQRINDDCTNTVVEILRHWSRDFAKAKKGEFSIEAYKVYTDAISLYHAYRTRLDIPDPSAPLEPGSYNEANLEEALRWATLWALFPQRANMLDYLDDGCPAFK